MRELLATHKDLLEKLTAMEKKYDEQFSVVFKAIRKLMEQPAGPESPAISKRRIGFTTDE